MPALVVDKAIITHVPALKAKYGPDGWPAIRAALDDLLQADQKRGLRTQVIDLGSAARMRRFKFAAVPRGDARAAKSAVDRVYRSLAPDYLLLLGASDVVPRVELTNPLYSPGLDDDRTVPSDLPYACDRPYGKSIADFIAPTRVVGRLPDPTNGRDPGPLAELLRVAADARPRPLEDYEAHLAVSAEVWKRSAELSLRAVFGAAGDLRLSPPEGPEWPDALLGRRLHFFNCHGAPADPRFYGQSGDHFPVAHEAALLAGRVAEGTVVAAECCYGASLFDPQLAGGQAGMAETYLAGGAYGFFGSSTVAYGPADASDDADLICQFFLRRVREGASLGRAALQARQDFVRQSSPLNPFHLKTLAQFSLLGDPAVRAVSRPEPPPALPLAKSRIPAEVRADRLSRAQRRAALAGVGHALAATVAVAVPQPAEAGTRAVAELRRRAAAAGMRAPAILSFRVEPPAGVGLPHALAARALPSAVHVALGRRPVPEAAPGVRDLHAIVLTEHDGALVTRHLFSR